MFKEVIHETWVVGRFPVNAVLSDIVNGFFGHGGTYMVQSTRAIGE